jgi:SAM-dependent methyltransferase
MGHPSDRFRGEKHEGRTHAPIPITRRIRNIPVRIAKLTCSCWHFGMSTLADAGHRLWLYLWNARHPGVPRRVTNEQLSRLFQTLKGSDASMSLDLGSGPTPRNPFQAFKCAGVDIRANAPNNVIYGDLSSGRLPFESGQFDYVTAFDVLEHVPRVQSSDSESRFPFVLLMNEIARVLRDGGIFFCIQPCFPSKEVFQDPTHVNVMTEDTVRLYFCERAWARIYGYEGSFAMLHEGWIGYKYFAFLRKSAAHPIRDLGFVQK